MILNCSFDEELQFFFLHHQICPPEDLERVQAVPGNSITGSYQVVRIIHSIVHIAESRVRPETRLGSGGMERKENSRNG